MPCAPSGWPCSRATGVHSAGCDPAAPPAAISCSGRPSLVTAPLNSLRASSSGRPATLARRARPEAPSPRASPSVRSPQSTTGSCSGGTAQPSGLPASASHDRRGRRSSQSGSRSKRLAEMRSSSSRCAPASPSGRACSRLPASMSFCRRGRSPTAPGRVSMALSVRISQRRAGGSAAAGTRVMRQALKPTISSAGQSPSTSGNVVKGLSEAKMTLSRCSRGNHAGSVVRRLPLRLSTSSESARPSTSAGSSVRPQERSRRVAPARSPRRSCSRVCIRHGLWNPHPRQTEPSS